MHTTISLSSLPERLAKSIISIHNSNSFLSKLDRLNPVYAGGYPMALLLAPRSKENSITSHYSDYDLYFQNQDQCKDAIELIKAEYTDHEEFVTENAVTIVGKKEEKKITYQVVTKFNYSPVDVVNTFDFTNCAIAYTPHNNTFTTHVDTVKDHCEKKLNIHNPWMLDKLLNDELTEDQIKTLASVQIVRFKKYMYRWDYELSDSAFQKLIEVYNKFPSIIAKRGSPLVIEEGSYKGFVHLVKTNQNLWLGMRSCITKHRLFTKFVDKHKVFRN
jgi:archaellin